MEKLEVSFNEWEDGSGKGSATDLRKITLTSRPMLKELSLEKIAEFMDQFELYRMKFPTVYVQECLEPNVLRMIVFTTGFGVSDSKKIEAFLKARATTPMELVDVKKTFIMKEMKENGDVTLGVMEFLKPVQQGLMNVGWTNKINERDGDKLRKEILVHVCEYVRPEHIGTLMKLAVRQKVEVPTIPQFTQRLIKELDEIKRQNAGGDACGTIEWACMDTPRGTLVIEEETTTTTTPPATEQEEKSNNKKKSTFRKGLICLGCSREGHYVSECLSTPKEEKERIAKDLAGKKGVTTRSQAKSNGE